jgi:phenylalanyl-tRNA synthetase alpha chain
MTNEAKWNEIYELIGKMSTAKGLLFLEYARELFQSAYAEIGTATDQTGLANFWGRWFDDNPGFFWEVWNNLPSAGRANFVWSQEPLRQLLLLPTECILRIGLSSHDFEMTYNLLNQYRLGYSVHIDSNEAVELVRRVEKAVGKQINETWMKNATGAVKAKVGTAWNRWLEKGESKLAILSQTFNTAAEQSAAARGQIDLSLPGIERAIGTRHLIRQTFKELERIFLSIGFSVVEGPEIETPYYNFEALNIPEHHPARDNMDTFYIEGARGGHLLRTHTSPMQIRTLEKQPPPVRIVVPGKVYRRDNPDSTHGYMFHQIEGLAVDTDITFCDFKGTVEYFVREFLGPKAKTRLRPSYFPFTEPSAEVDATCHVCGGSGCRVCKFSGWIELFGAGMVNPAVYGFVNYDARKLSGFAFGMGVDRLAMMKYGISELPLLYQNDARFLRQFP